MQHILDGYPHFVESTLTDRFFKHAQVMKLIDQLPDLFKTSTAGFSKEGRAIKLIQCGSGTTKVFLWSQMHGDEPTGTMAIFDLLNFLHQGFDGEITRQLLHSCTLYFLPMVNPDGAECFTRRNSQQIDINRDYIKNTSPEGKILSDTRALLKPDFGFNLHDQSTLWSVKNTEKPAVLSYLAPAYDEELHVNETREKSMKVIAAIFSLINLYLPDQIGLFDDEFECRAFGDNFQMEGTSTILIEAGGLQGDPEKQEIRKYYFLSILTGLLSIANQTYEDQNTDDYFKIPGNTKNIFHILIRDVLIEDFRTSIGINYTETPDANGTKTTRSYSVEDLGDLSGWSAYISYAGKDLRITGEINFCEPANFELVDADEIILSFENGNIHSKQYFSPLI